MCAHIVFVCMSLCGCGCCIYVVVSFAHILERQVLCAHTVLLCGVSHSSRYTTTWVVVHLPSLWVNYDQNAPVVEVDVLLGYTPWGG